MLSPEATRKHTVDRRLIAIIHVVLLNPAAPAGYSTLINLPQYSAAGQTPFAMLLRNRLSACDCHDPPLLT